MKKLFLAALALIMLAAHAQAAERRIALVVGNANYQTGALPTPANDAGLVAQTLQAAGFDVTGARDLDQDSLRHAIRDFVDKAASSGPDTVAFIYLSGYGLQLEGENYFVPIDARINSAANAPAEALRISDFTRPLAALGLKVTVLVLDLARANPFAQSGPTLRRSPRPCGKAAWLLTMCSRGCGCASTRPPTARKCRGTSPSCGRRSICSSARRTRRRRR